MKNEQYRRDGVRLAYHIVKGSESLEDALKALEARLTRTEQTNAPVLIRDDALKDFEARVKNNVYTMMLSCVFALLEKPEYNFSKEQMSQLAEDMAELIDTVYGGWLDFPDLLDYFKDEYGIDLAEHIAESQERLDRIEAKLDKRTEFVGDKRYYQRRLEK